MGKLIVFEGIDGSGKSTQFDILVKRFEEEQLDFKRISFPRYDEPSSVPLRMYLAGDFGDDPDDVNPYAASSFFAIDRYASFMQDWRSYYENGGIILTDRYTTSNAIHQGAKLLINDRETYFKWLYDYEFKLMGLPSPDCVIYFDIDITTAAKRLNQRQIETDTAADIHERDLAYLSQCIYCGLHAADFYNWRIVPCVAQNRERTIEEIHEDVYNIIGEYISYP
ncbi:MAG: thymidylate kinase [Oscillospiraceae bacterium]|nr:thymidylate kinase [Oscillospiraceae bacterium]